MLSKGTRGLIAAVSVTAVMVAGGLLIQREVPAQDLATEVVEPIGSSTLLCPEPGAGADVGVRVTAAVVPGQQGQDGTAGSASIQTLEGKISAEAAISAPGGQAEVAAQGRTLPPISVIGVGSLAPGLVADQWSRDSRGQGRGMGSTACSPAATEFWFVGGGSVAGRQTRVVLVNPDDNAAVVDIIVLGPDGEIDAPAGRGLVVKGQRRLVVRLDSLVPGTAATAVHVVARTGRIAATVNDDQMSGLISIGTDWIPAAAMPATTVYVPGVMPGKGVRVLTIAAPGEDDATVKIRIISKAGTFAPADRDTVRVTAGSVASLDMSSVTRGEPVTLELTAETPIVAGLRQFTNDKKVQQDTAFTSGSQPFSGPAAVSGLPVGPATTVHLSITAPSTDAAVDITFLPYRGGREIASPTAPRRVTVKAGELAWVLLDAPAGIDWFTAVVTPADGSGPVLLAHRVREASSFGDLITGYPWSKLRVTVAVPTAVQDLGLTVR
jgi:hypothetical protein